MPESGCSWGTDVFLSSDYDISPLTASGIWDVEPSGFVTWNAEGNCYLYERTRMSWHACARSSVLPNVSGWVGQVLGSRGWKSCSAVPPVGAAVWVAATLAPCQHTRGAVMKEPALASLPPTPSVWEMPASCPLLQGVGVGEGWTISHIFSSPSLSLCLSDK